MMCKNCKHAFCWYCLESLDDDFLLIHYDKGPCRNKLGHSRASVIWHRTQCLSIALSLDLFVSLSLSLSLSLVTGSLSHSRSLSLSRWWGYLLASVCSY
ncbi:unnamed protein product, partial [Oncorhynchus mykiss]